MLEVGGERMRATKKLRGIGAEARGISPLVATLILILVAVVGGGIVYNVMRSQASSYGSSADLQLQSIDVVSAGDVCYASATVKNVGTVALEGVEVKISSDSDDQTIYIGPLAPGESKGGEVSPASVVWTAGKTYIVTIRDKNNTVVKTTTVLAHG